MSQRFSQYHGVLLLNHILTSDSGFITHIFTVNVVLIGILRYLEFSISDLIPVAILNLLIYLSSLWYSISLKYWEASLIEPF
jgi:hypothetical protein